MRTLALLFALALGAAAPSVAQQAPPDALAPPAPQDVATHIRAADAGTTIKASVGEKIAIELVATPSAGLTWSVAAQPGFLSAPEIATGPLIAAQQRPGFVGGNRWQVFVFTVGEAGAGAVDLQERSARAPAGAPTANFEVTIEAQ